jgi:hypothetical protein
MLIQCVLALCFQYSSSYLRTLLKFSLAARYFNTLSSLLESWCCSIPFLYLVMERVNRVRSLAPHASRSSEQCLSFSNNGTCLSLFHAPLTTSFKSCSSNQAVSNLKALDLCSFDNWISLSNIGEWSDRSAMALINLKWGNSSSHLWVTRAWSLSN